MPEALRPRHIFLEIAYDGTDFHGWQIQPNALTVQEKLQQVVSELYGGRYIHIYGSSRTDTGVHAMGFAAHATVPESPYIPFENLFKALNRRLPDTIKIRRLEVVPDDFHARFGARGKAYTYVLNLGEKTPFLARYSWHLPQCSRLDEVRAALEMLTGTHDFSSFAAEAGRYDDPVRTIYRIEAQHFGSLLCLTFVGNGFLYKMIRSLMGAITAVGMGRLEPDDIARIMAARQRTAHVETCPPQGLFLMKVFYDDAAMHSFHLDRPPMMY
ncbi:MAG: tRNA pseudouridine(38-40) synthase TruA [Victivallales bacterium]|nr:tRNA pseudouridine(38-40) synthase TruA [Victivallales bacterium]